MTYMVTVLGGSTSIQINDGPITITPPPERVTVILSCDGIEIDRREMGRDETYSGIQISGEKASLVIGKKREFTVEIGGDNEEVDGV